MAEKPYAKHPSDSTTHYIADLATRAPAAAVSSGGHRVGTWLPIPYETQAVSGVMLWTGPETAPPPARIPLGARGWHALYVGLWSLEDESDNGVRLRLSADRCYTFMRRENPDPFFIDERYWKCADLTGQDVLLAASQGLPRQGALAYIKLVPLSEEDVTELRAERERRDTKRLIAMNDGFSDFGTYRPTCAEDIWEWIEPYRDTDFGALFWCVASGDVCTYDTQVATLQNEGIQDYPRIADRFIGESLQKLIREQGIDPLATALGFAHQIGLELHASFRVNAFGWAAPFDEVFSGPLYRQHPELCCVDRDGTPVARMSYAYPQVRETALSVIREALGYGVDGLSLIFPRAGPFLLYEAPVVDGFRREVGLDPLALPEDDARWLAYRAHIMTDFMRAVRAVADDAAAGQGRGRLPISAHVHNRQAVDDFYGLDVATWAREGLIDVVIPYPWEANDVALIDMAHYKAVVAGSACRLYPDIFPAGLRQAGYDLLSAAQAFYDAGADGLCLWDTNGFHAQVEAWPAVQRLGHREELATWRERPTFRRSTRVRVETLDGKSFTHHPPHWSYCYRYRWPQAPSAAREFRFRGA